MSEGPDEVISALERRGGETIQHAVSAASAFTMTAAGRAAHPGNPQAAASGAAGARPDRDHGARAAGGDQAGARGSAAAQAAATAAQGLPLDPRAQLAASRRGPRPARETPAPRRSRPAERAL